MNQEKFESMYGNVIWTGKPCSFFGLPWNFTRYILTDKKLIIRTGFLNIKEEKIELYRIVDTSMNHPITQRIFGCGTINLMSKDVSCPNVSLKEIKNPYMVRELPPLSPTCLNWGLPIEFPLKANPAVPAVLLIL